MSWIYTTKTFDRWAKKANLSDKALINAVLEMEKGIIHADLGGSLYKQRVPLLERGKRGSVRTIIAARIGDTYFFSLWVREEREG